MPHGPTGHADALCLQCYGCYASILSRRSHDLGPKGRSWCPSGGTDLTPRGRLCVEVGYLHCPEVAAETPPLTCTNEFRVTTGCFY